MARVLPQRKLACPVTSGGIDQSETDIDMSVEKRSWLKSSIVSSYYDRISMALQYGTAASTDFAINRVIKLSKPKAKNKGMSRSRISRAIHTIKHCTLNDCFIEQDKDITSGSKEPTLTRTERTI
jgi:hypothetical protein